MKTGAAGTYCGIDKVAQQTKPGSADTAFAVFGRRRDLVSEFLCTRLKIA